VREGARFVILRDRWEVKPVAKDQILVDLASWPASPSAKTERRGLPVSESSHEDTSPETLPSQLQPDEELHATTSGNDLTNSSATQGEAPADLQQVENSLRIAKLKLELGKLALDKRLAERQLSRQGVTLSWIQAGTVLVAIIGITASFYIGQRQVNLSQNAAHDQSAQAEENRASDRFDKALSRLADSNSAGVRLTGVAGLRLFLSDGNNRHQSEAVHYLITAIAEEKSQEVQQAILDAFAEANQFSQEAKDLALRTAVELNRTLTRATVHDIHFSRANLQKTLFATFVPKEAATWTGDYSFINGLTFLQRIQLESISTKSLFYDPTKRDADVPENTATLEKYVTLINGLLAAGAKTDNNWTKIYCQKCNFAKAANLSNAHFDESYLSGADFSRANLQGSTFRNADLNGTMFFSSDLSNADLSWDNYPVSDAQLNAARERSFTSFPFLECANLSGANLTNLPLALLWRPVNGRTTNLTTGVGESISVPRMAFTIFDKRTRIGGLGVVLQFHIYNHEYLELSATGRRSFDAGFWIDNASWPVGWDFRMQSNINLSEVEGSESAAGSSKETSFRKTRVLKITDPKGIEEWARPLFRAALDRTTWKSLPLVARIIANSQGSLDPVFEIYNGGRPPETCSQTPVGSRDLEIVLSTNFKK
jgi:uncharacterized protein YjbI with pentapeptide repeats